MSLPLGMSIQRHELKPLRISDLPHEVSDLRHETEPLRILEAVTTRTIPSNCKSEDGSERHPQFNIDCTFNVIAKAIQRMTQLYPDIAITRGLTGYDGDHEINALLELSEVCPTDLDVEPYVFGELYLAGKSACAYRVLKDFVAEASEHPLNPAGSKKDTTAVSSGTSGHPLPTESFYGVNNNKQLILLLLLLGFALTYYFRRDLMTRPMFWMLLFLALAVMVAMNQKSQQPLPPVPVEPGDQRSVKEHITVEEKTPAEYYFGEHSQPLRAKAMHDAMFELSTEQKYGETYFREESDKIHARAKHSLWFGK